MPAGRKPSAVDTYRTHLRLLANWDDYLREESRLPGPRANLELLAAVVEEGNRPRFDHLLALDAAFPSGAPPNTPDEFLTVCAVAGLGKLVAAGESQWLAELRRYAADDRWRVREAVAIALQRWGDDDMDALVVEMTVWSSDGWLVQRAAVAALAEPRLLRDAGHAPAVIAIFDAITRSTIDASPSTRRDSPYGVLRQALGYAWSVLVACQPLLARQPFERWLTAAEITRDKDLLWIARRNLKKNRLQVLDRTWANGWSERLGAL
jgi:hypothetical protein